MTCVICKRGETGDSKATVTLHRGDTVVIIRDTPAQVCTTCGEYYLDEVVAQRVFSHAEDAVKRRAEVEILRYAGEHGREIVDLVERAAADTVARGRDPQPDDVVGVNYGIASRSAGGELVYRYPAYALMDAEIDAWDLATQRARHIDGGTRKQWRNVFYCRFVPEIAVRRPRGYLVPAARMDVVDHLRALEAESIQIMREVVAEFERPVMLYSIGKDSTVLLRLAQKAFHPAPIPFPLLHVNTTWKYGTGRRSASRAAIQSRACALWHLGQCLLRQLL